MKRLAFLARFGATVCALAFAGCAGHLEPRVHPPAGLSDTTRSIPKDSRDRVHIFIINGLTVVPHFYGSLEGVPEYLQELGFPKPRAGTHYARGRFQDEIRRIHRANPDARFAFIGYSIGASVIYGMAQDLDADGVVVDLLVYLDGHSFVHDMGRPTANVRRVVNIVSAGPLLGAEPLEGVENFHVKEAWHLSAPRNSETLTILARELAAVATAARSRKADDSVPMGNGEP